jgi:hypothetical protein
MSRSLLHWSRIFAPGVMAALLLITLLDPNRDALKTVGGLDFGTKSITGLAVIVFGGLYELLNIRYRFGFSWDGIQHNIINRLLEIYRSRFQLSSGQEAFLRAKRRLLDIFYSILDNDESLKSRQEGVRLNGLLVTSCVDLGIISVLGWVLHILLLFASGEIAHLYWATAMFILGLLSTFVLIPIALNKHEKLSNEQIDFIQTRQFDDFASRVHAILVNPIDPQGAA